MRCQMADSILQHNSFSHCIWRNPLAFSGKPSWSPVELLNLPGTSPFPIVILCKKMENFRNSVYWQWKTEISTAAVTIEFHFFLQNCNYIRKKSNGIFAINKAKILKRNIYRESVRQTEPTTIIIIQVEICIRHWNLALRNWANKPQSAMNSATTGR